MTISRIVYGVFYLALFLAFGIALVVLPSAQGDGVFIQRGAAQAVADDRQADLEKAGTFIRRQKSQEGAGNDD